MENLSPRTPFKCVAGITVFSQVRNNCSEKCEILNMKFFIPHAKDEAQAEQVYEASKKFCEQQTGWRVLPRKIYSLRYRHNGKEYIAQVGSEDPTEGLVICIFESEVTYFVCTPNRGVARGDPILIGKEEVSDIQLFDQE